MKSTTIQTREALAVPNIADARRLLDQHLGVTENADVLFALLYSFVEDRDSKLTLTAYQTEVLRHIWPYTEAARAQFNGQIPALTGGGK